MSSDEEYDESGSGSGSEEMDDSGEDSTEEKVRVKVRTAKEILEKPIEEIEKVNEIFQISGVVARQLLRHFKWNSEKVVSRYFEGQKDKLFQEAKIPTNLSEWKKPNQTITCTICEDDVAPENIMGLPCNHFFCKECYTDYLVFLITKSAQSGGIMCPKKGCNLQLDEVTILSLLPKEGKARDLYYILAAKEYVKDRPELKSCPAGGCDKIIEYHKELHPDDIPIVECSCGERMCWDCGLADHSPATCRMLQDWNKKTEGDSQTQNWIKLYTKQCPSPKGCAAIITKDGGCQYMRCATCGHGFCWICLGAFDHKNHNCNALKIDPNSDKIAQDLAKYEHFSKRFAMHAQSITFQSKLKGKCEELMNKLNKEQGMNWNEIQFVEQARLTTILARRMLRDTYIFGYFLPKGVNPQLFEFIQGELESNTEKLTSFLEGDPKNACQKHLQIKDLSVAIRKNIDSVVEDLYKGNFKGGKEQAKVWEPTMKVGYDGWIYNAGN